MIRLQLEPLSVFFCMQSFKSCIWIIILPFQISYYYQIYLLVGTFRNFPEFCQRVNQLEQILEPRHQFLTSYTVYLIASSKSNVTLSLHTVRRAHSFSSLKLTLFPLSTLLQQGWQLDSVCSHTALWHKQRDQTVKKQVLQGLCVNK